jgi:cobalt-zinc-cadmium efflux system outer membrane protein
MIRRLLCAALILLHACTPLNPTQPFTQVQTTIKDRTGYEISWDHDTPEKTEIHSHIKELLKGTITLKGAVEVALLNNPKLQAHYEDLGMGQADLVQAGLLTNPGLSLERRFKGQAADADITQDLLSAFLIPLRTKARTADLEAIQQRLMQVIIDHIAKVKRAFYSLQASCQLFDMQQHVVRALEASYQAKMNLFDAGNIRDIDVKVEQTLLAQARTDLAQSGQQIIEDRERLNILMGMWGEGTDWRIEKRLPELPNDVIHLENLESYAVSQRTDLLAARKNLESLAAQVGLSRYQALIPGISASYHFEREIEGVDSKGPSLGLPLPLFNWGNAASVMARTQFTKALRHYQSLAIEIRSDVRLAYAQMEGARTRVAYFVSTILPLQQRMLDQTQLLYNAMSVGVFQLLQAKQAQIAAGRSYINELKEFWVARAQLEQVTGGSLSIVRHLDQESNPLRPDFPAMHDRKAGEQHKHHHGNET